MTNYFQFKRGLGKEDIGIPLYHCHCGKTMGLWAVDDGTGKRAYRCKKHAQAYKRWKDRGRS